jgi:Fe-S oxidoreductase
MAMISAGDLEAARELAQINVRILAEHARMGKPIICTEPTAAVCLKYEYPRLIQHPDVQLVSAQTVEAGAYLQLLHQRGRMKTDFQELRYDFLYHTPCHQRYLSPNSPVSLLSLVPGLNLRRIERGCSGMAGAFGLTAKSFEKSVAMGAGLIAEMQETTAHAGVTECSSCRMQMEQDATVPTVHPLKLLALAYGLMPEIQERLTAVPRGKLVMR